MRQYSAAFLSPALGVVKALLLAPRGRHARRRHRSTRVRRYAPLPQAVTRENASPPPAPDPVRVPAPRLAPAPAPLPADDPVLVRPYYSAWEHRGATARERARERELERVRAAATARLCDWAHREVPPCGDLLAPDPTPVAVPAPRAPHPDCEDPDDWRTFTRLTRTWLAQREHHRRARPRDEAQHRSAGAAA
ncbi:hypothetical protein [Nocardiopsis tropica]|uniref:Uncharacterized protein n=1 Tax=Nocardiopsis tropica TaxID=109330 RepID=A0ABU7KJT3_9ACTN|nr:hypothetical protein [Nocardiopsis umidischolae]MEE2049547.1 hypothetical protein [Nocardiopsis umidischolae]